MKPLMAIALFWLLLGGSPTLARVEQQDRDLITQPVFMCGSGLHSAANSKTRIFESVPTRPLALSDDGTLLFVVNAPANCLEIYQTDKAELVLASTVSVGLDPVSVAQRSRHEVWVVNHVSDSVSIVDIAGRPRVIDTLQVGDAPWDVVFADRGIEPREPTVNRRNRAFISASFRGQHHPQFAVQHLLKNRVDNPAGDPGETIGRADLWVMDIDEHSGSISRAGIINLFTDSLRSLAVSKDGARVFATSFRSGNRTTTVPVPSEKLVGERWSADGMGHPEPMLIVQQDGQDRWRDLSGEDWSARVNYSIADNDLFIIDASSDLTLGTAARPRFNRHAVLDTVKGIGTILFNGVFDDRNDRFLVTALEANNVQPMQEQLKGRFVKNQLVVVDLKAKSHPRIHKIELDADAFGSSAHPSGMALPGALAISDDGTDVLLASMGGNKLTRLRLSANAEHPPKASDVVQQFVGKPHRGVAEPVGGPIGVLADQGWRHVYVYTLFDNKLALFANTPEGLKKRDEHKMPNPETLPIQYGRQYLYDATLTSGNGSVACASCHIFGGTDRLQWDLSKKDAPIEHVHIGYVAHPDRDIPDLRTTIRAIALKADPTTATVGARVELGGKQLPVVFVGDKKSFADALDRQVIDLQAPGLVYLRPGPVDARLAKFHRIGEAGTWLLIDTPFFHPLKGPMLTLPLYGLSHSGPMHFRGDVQGEEPNAGNHCPAGSTQEERALKEFNTPCDGSAGTFEALHGGTPLSASEMDVLTRFVFALTYPPNPIRPLDNTVNELGEQIFLTAKMGPDVTDREKIVKKSPLIFRCVDCHTLDRTAQLFGTSKLMYSAPPLTLQDAKIPHLRFLYDRIGFFRGDYRFADAYIRTPGRRDTVKKYLFKSAGLFKSEYQKSSQMLATHPLDYYDELIHAAGFNHGAFFDATMFFTSFVWILDSEDPNRVKPETVKRYEALFDYLMGFDTELFPMFGQQFTLRATDLRELQAGGNRAAERLEAFERYLAAAYTPKGYDEAQCIPSYHRVEDENTVHQQVFPGGVQGAGSSGPSLRARILALSPDHAPLTFTCQ